MGAIACVVVAVAMVAVALSLTGGDDSATTAGDALPASGGVTAGAGDETALPSSTIVSPSPLAVTPESDETTTTLLATTTTLSVTTTAAPATTVATTAAPTTTEATTTVAPSSSEAPSTTADSSSTTVDTMPSTSVSDSSSTTVAGGSTTTAGPSTTIAQTTTTVETTEPTGPPSGSLNAVELEIARLTNELRTNPNGNLKREGAAIDCSGRIGVDLSTGQYQSIGALIVDQTASLQVARPWSAQMTTSNFVHQPRAGITALQAAGISVRSAGENIAYHNFSDKALNHFVGWRESDGHFCNMMDPNFTHIGVGEVTKSDGISYATQNFFSTR